MVASNDRLKMTPDEMKASAESILSNFGTYTVNEAEKSFTVQFESSSFANQTVAPGKRMVEITGDEMRLSNPTRIGGGQITDCMEADQIGPRAAIPFAAVALNGQIAPSSYDHWACRTVAPRACPFWDPVR